jgi:hypothetical protein
MEHAGADGPLSQSDQALAFLAAYGWAMWAVQQFEYRLAVLTILRSPVKSPNRRIDSAQKLHSALQKQFASVQHRLGRASAKELRNLLPVDLSETLRANLDDLIDVRNDLAHDYLRRTLGASTPDLQTALRTMQALGERFVAAGDVLLELAEAGVAARPPHLSDEQFDNLQRLGRAAAAGTPLDQALAELAASAPE